MFVLTPNFHDVRHSEDYMLPSSNIVQLRLFTSSYQLRLGVHFRLLPMNEYDRMRTFHELRDWQNYI